jgi:glycosyltransferase involved in cell wall biosynthesis
MRWALILPLLIADDPFAFAGMVIDLLQDEDLFEETRINARELVCSDYAWEKIGTDLNKVLNQVIKPLNKSREKR